MVSTSSRPHTASVTSRTIHLLRVHHGLLVLTLGILTFAGCASGTGSVAQSAQTRLAQTTRTTLAETTRTALVQTPVQPATSALPATPALPATSAPEPTSAPLATSTVQIAEASPTENS